LVSERTQLNGSSVNCILGQRSNLADNSGRIELRERDRLSNAETHRGNVASDGKQSFWAFDKALESNCGSVKFVRLVEGIRERSPKHSSWNDRFKCSHPCLTIVDLFVRCRSASQTPPFLAIADSSRDRRYSPPSLLCHGLRKDCHQKAGHSRSGAGRSLASREGRTWNSPESLDSGFTARDAAASQWACAQWLPSARGGRRRRGEEKKIKRAQANQGPSSPQSNQPRHNSEGVVV
jgi:hypothetical protein